VFFTDLVGLLIDTFQIGIGFLELTVPEVVMKRTNFNLLFRCCLINFTIFFFNFHYSRTFKNGYEVGYLLLGFQGGLEFYNATTRQTMAPDGDGWVCSTVQKASDRGKKKGQANQKTLRCAGKWVPPWITTSTVIHCGTLFSTNLFKNSLSIRLLL